MRPTALVLVALASLAAAAMAGRGGGGGGGGGEGRRPEARVRQGRLRGEWLETARRRVRYASFRAIPYAAPPLGPLRFKDPRPAARWAGVREATAWGAECTQLEGGQPKGAEDCLFLNVFVPPGAWAGAGAASAAGPLPVLVYFPGGAFVRGSSNRYGPDYFMEAGGALLVTVNYRLGVFGFLSLGTADVPGNAALKDQTLALRWVRDNIAAFGGDPARVTIFGQSAGGASVHAHVLSPLSAGLFGAAVSISGSMLAQWALPRDAALQRRRLLERAGCADGRPEVWAACLRTLPAYDLVKAGGSVDLMREMLRDQQIPFTPVVDGAVPGATPFLPDRPRRLISTGRFNRVPYVAGVTSGEVLHFMASAPANTPHFVEEGLANLTRQFKEQMAAALPAGLPLNASDLARDVYRPDSRSGQHVLERLVEAANDAFFVWPAALSTRLQSAFEPRQYLYYFDLDAGLDLRKPALMPFLKQIEGVPHGGDLFYMFRIPDANTTLPEKSIEMRTLRSYVQLILNIAITGKPTPQPVEGVLWPPYDSDADGAYLNFGTDLLSAKTALRKKQLMVWDLLSLLISNRHS
ncbi:hypothetical protein R5R35_002961 [Gryllus longicercus]|uniref:Carboxylic ester hydrolase n=1 Tax=Gryllus longicercus TaxID=2509291 RepID=A0AAN9YZ09_9ORTH